MRRGPLLSLMLLFASARAGAAPSMPEPEGAQPDGGVTSPVDGGAAAVPAGAGSDAFAADAGSGALAADAGSGALAADAGSGALAADAGAVAAGAASPTVAPAADGGTSRLAGHPGFVVLRLGSNKPASDYAPALTDKLAQRLVAAGLSVRTQDDISRLLGAERQKELLGCADDGNSCMLELTNALGSRYVVAGRVDRLGDHFLVNVSVTDSVDASVVVNVHREAGEVDDLPGALDQVADDLLAHFGLQQSKPFFTPADPMGFNLSLRLGSTLITSIAALAPEVQLELGYRVSRAWAPFLQISAHFTIDKTTTVQITPGLLGLRYYFREAKSLQPTLGAGLGVVSTIGTFQGTTRPSLVVLGGLQWFVVDRIGVGLEASVDLLGLAFEYADTGKTGLNLGLSLGVMYRF